jgi:hypothetical protein
LNPELVAKQGMLYRKGMLQRFNKPYMFYLEKKDENGWGPVLKYGKKGKGVRHALDLGKRAGGGEEQDEV